MRKDLLKIYVILLFLMLVGCREDLVHLGSELDANRVLFALRDKGIEASKTSIGKEWVVRIAKADLTGALRVLEEKKIFQGQADALNDASSNIFQSKEEKKDFRDKDLARNLSSTIRLIPLVREARVHIYNKYNDPLELHPVNERSASVLIVHDAGVVNEDVVKELVSQGAGLLKEKVSVLFVLAEVRKEEQLNTKENIVTEPAENKLLGAMEKETSYEKITRSLTNSLNVYYALIIFPFLIFFYLFKKLKHRRKNISRTDLLGKLNEESMRNGPT